MGFIKSIFGIVGGIFKAILGVFGVGKKSEFYMEIEEDAAATPAPVATPTPAAEPAVAQTVAEPVATSPAAAPTPATKPAPAKPAASVPSFANNYLTGPTMPRRRRPGPSLSPFMDMAKQVKAR